MEPVHPKGRGARVLLSSVFGPYAVDDEYGSRRINPMELYHNQVTREQGAFSLRMFHRSFGLMLIKENIDAPCTLLDFPDLERFIDEIDCNEYDIVGISSIIPNMEKVRKMCELIRIYLPGAAIVVGGHIANVPDLDKRIDVDHICKGEGVSWFRRFLGSDEDVPIRHPYVYSGFGTRIVGINTPEIRGNTAAMVIPSVGCPMGCNFCSTSALFGGKGRFVNFYETGDELFKVMDDIEKRLKVHTFFIMDENFLLHRKRALRLLELMKQHKKSWSMFVFSSAKILQTYSIQELIRLGISWVWMGLEGKDSQYEKLEGVDTRILVSELQSHGIRVLGSTIIGLEDHRPENICRVIDHAVSHNAVFHQFMLYTALPGTPLYEQHASRANIIGEEKLPTADVHGQYRFNFHHEHITGGMETSFLKEAFVRDFKENGPSLMRMIRVMLDGWKRYKLHPDPCVRRRFMRDMRYVRSTYASAVWAMKRWYSKDNSMSAKIESLLHDIYSEFGLKARLIVPLIGMYAYYSIKKEQKRLDAGWTYEPSMFYEKNKKAVELEKQARIGKRIYPLPHGRLIHQEVQNACVRNQAG